MKVKERSGRSEGSGGEEGKKPRVSERAKERARNGRGMKEASSWEKKGRKKEQQGMRKVRLKGEKKE